MPDSADRAASQDRTGTHHSRSRRTDRRYGPRSPPVPTRTEGPTGLWHLSIIVAIAAWQAYTAFDRFFTLTTEEMANRSNEVWFSIGPISLFLASALGLLFALGAVTTKHQTGKNFWSALLWVPTGWLA